MSGEVVDDCLPALKFIPNGFVTSKVIRKLFPAFHSDDNIKYFNKNSGDVKFFCNEFGVLNNKDLNNIDLNHTNHNESDPDTIIHVRRFTWHIRFKKRRNTEKR